MIKEMKYFELDGKSDAAASDADSFGGQGLVDAIKAMSKRYKKKGMDFEAGLFEEGAEKLRKNLKLPEVKGDIEGSKGGS